jgi:hypothetical protein
MTVDAQIHDTPAELPESLVRDGAWQHVFSFRPMDRTRGAFVRVDGDV